MMAQLIRVAFDDNSMEVAIATFSGQTTLIEQIMEHIIMDGKLVDSTKKLPVYGGDYCCWNYEGSKDGKQAHIGTAIRDFGKSKNRMMHQKSTTVLIDDDRNNIMYAELDSTRSVWYHPEAPDESLLQDLLLLPVLRSEK